MAADEAALAAEIPMDMPATVSLQPSPGHEAAMLVEPPMDPMATASPRPSADHEDILRSASVLQQTEWLAVFQGLVVDANPVVITALRCQLAKVLLHRGDPPPFRRLLPICLLKPLCKRRQKKRM